jgi:hypothetical protein
MTKRERHKRFCEARGDRLMSEFVAREIAKQNAAKASAEAKARA